MQQCEARIDGIAVPALRHGTKTQKLRPGFPRKSRAIEVLLNFFRRAARRSLARAVGERFCVRARCGFAGILDVWQEAAAPPWHKRSGERRRHTAVGTPYRKNRVKLQKPRIPMGLRGAFYYWVRYLRKSAQALSIRASHCCVSCQKPTRPQRLFRLTLGRDIPSVLLQ